MLAAAERARKQAETERDELSEELASNSSGKWVSSPSHAGIFRHDLLFLHLFFLFCSFFSSLDIQIDAL